MLSRRNEHKKTFDEATIEKINLMLAKVDTAYEVMIANLNAAHEGTLSSIANAYSAEEQINVLRNELREAEIEALEDNQKNYQTSVYYIDIINELEHMGDYMINISQSLERAFVGK
jgi:phosphate:Na+ symporter